MVKKKSTLDFTKEEVDKAPISALINMLLLIQHELYSTLFKDSEKTKKLFKQRERMAKTLSRKTKVDKEDDN